MQKQISPKTIALSFGVLILLFITAFYISAWTEPSQAPPGGNVPTPLNVGDDSQEKAASLSFPVFYDNPDTSYYVDPGGQSILAGPVGIGTMGPEEKLDVAGYVKGTGLCIGSDCRTAWPNTDFQLVYCTDWPGIDTADCSVSCPAEYMAMFDGIRAECLKDGFRNKISYVYYRLEPYGNAKPISGTAQMSCTDAGSEARISFYLRCTR